MIEIAQGFVGLSHQLSTPSLFLGQAANPGLAASLGLDPNTFNVILSLIGAIAILLLGWIIASVLAALTRSLLKRTQIDERIAGMTMGQRGESAISVDNIASAIVFWIVLILAIVAALNVLNLTTVSQPLNNFLNQIFAYLPRIGGAAILIGVAWLLATLSKMVALRVARSFSLDERLSGTTTDGTPVQNQFMLSNTLGNALYWFVFLFFLPLILSVLNLQGPLQPVQNLLNEFLAALPNIIKAIVIGFIGWLIAKIVRDIVSNLLMAAGVDRVGNKFGLAQGSGRQSLSWIIGTVVYVLILIPAAVAALEALRINSISAPASAMLNQILNAIPQIFTAALILVLGYVLGQFVKDLVTNLLTGIGFNNVLYWLGLQTSPPTHLPPPPSLDRPEGEPMLIEPDAISFQTRTPSEIAGIVVLVGIVLFSAVAATNVLGIQALTLLVGGLLVILGQILVGLAIFAVGLYLANLAYGLIASSNTSQSKILGQTARIAILVLVSAMALQQIGIAPNIINLAFGLLLGAISVAIALAFGLGGRDVAADQLREWLSSFKQNR